MSANHYVFELFLQKDMAPDDLVRELDTNLPNDIKAVTARKTGSGFNIIRQVKEKEYLYLFSFKGKAHPFCAPIMASFHEDLDIELMKAGALLFEGEHNFSQYCTKPGPKMKFTRTVFESRIRKNTRFTASFFPEHSWLYTVRSKGFLRHQVRLMTGQLLRLGRHDIHLADIENSLTAPGKAPLPVIAPASGLMLNRVVHYPEQVGGKSPIQPSTRSGF